jgi:hypothetical protein
LKVLDIETQTEVFRALVSVAQPSFSLNGEEISSSNNQIPEDMFTDARATVWDYSWSPVPPAPFAYSVEKFFPDSAGFLGVTYFRGGTLVIDHGPPAFRVFRDRSPPLALETATDLDALIDMDFYNNASAQLSPDGTRFPMFQTIEGQTVFILYDTYFATPLGPPHPAQNATRISFSADSSRVLLVESAFDSGAVASFRVFSRDGELINSLVPSTRPGATIRGTPTLTGDGSRVVYFEDDCPAAVRLRSMAVQDGTVVDVVRTPNFDQLL